ncbi:uncharacterized protein LOC125854781 [Solanum stenotomum]|uniref:uncharacterized protein LOC125854781 n=1 Tax=Solanum stenotomum TaxID=172797 RepID=UPI0020D10560|nr:uncharacterized protein LOC125854781 [Solanum stenotomum]
MDITEVDHYVVLDLPSGEQGAKLSQQEISKAYRKKALELHPDKRPDDPNAHENFRKLKTSYDILKDEKNRKLFDSTRKITISDLDLKARAEAEARERAAAAAAERYDFVEKEELRLARIAAHNAQRMAGRKHKEAGRKINHGRARIRAMRYVNKVSRSISSGKTKKEADRILASINIMLSSALWDMVEISYLGSPDGARFSVLKFREGN